MPIKRLNGARRRTLIVRMREAVGMRSSHVVVLSGGSVLGGIVRTGGEKETGVSAMPGIDSEGLMTLVTIGPSAIGSVETLIESVGAGTRAVRKAKPSAGQSVVVCR